MLLLKSQAKTIAIREMKGNKNIIFINMEDSKFYHSPDGSKIIYTTDNTKQKTYYSASNMPKDGYVQLNGI